MKVTIANNPCGEISLGVYVTFNGAFKCTLTTMFGVYRPDVRKKMIMKMFDFTI